MDPIIDRYIRIKNKYLIKFGKDALDRVIAPVYETNGSLVNPEFLKFIDNMEMAIETGTPIEQVSEEIWQNLVF